MKNRTLNVKLTTLKEVTKKWGFTPALFPKETFGDLLYPTLFIRCNAKGHINWDKAPVYTSISLKEMSNYKIQL